MAFLISLGTQFLSLLCLPGSGTTTITYPLPTTRRLQHGCKTLLCAPSHPITFTSFDHLIPPLGHPPIPRHHTHPNPLFKKRLSPGGGSVLKVALIHQMQLLPRRLTAHRMHAHAPPTPAPSLGPNPLACHPYVSWQCCPNCRWSCPPG